MEKDSRRLVLTATPLVFLLILPLVYAAFFAAKNVPSNEWKQVLSSWRTRLGTRNGDRGAEELESLKLLLRGLVRDEGLDELEATGFACHSSPHSEVCIADKPVRIDTHALTVYVPSQGPMPQGEHIVRPYPWKNDNITMNTVTPVQILHGSIAPPACDHIHNVPAVVFSSSGFVGNLFHEFDEILIPLFITSHHFQSQVQFIITDYKSWFVNKYSQILSTLSRYEAINPAADGKVHCFPGAVFGLEFHKSLTINSTDTPGGYSMLDFKQFLRNAYSLKVETVPETKKPVLILISRKRSRVFLNEEEMVRMMEELGFQVIATRANRMSNLGKFAKVLNSGSVLVGAHGAGLTNQLFLPTGAVMVQVVPLGLEWPSTAYFGEPAHDMGVHYLEYKIEPEESSLYSLYGRDDPVILDPESIYSKGYFVGRAVYIDGQNLKINLTRFRETLVEAQRLLSSSTYLNSTTSSENE